MHLAGGFGIAAVSSVLPLTNVFMPIYKKYPLYGIVSVILLFIVVIYLVTTLTAMPAGSPTKYFLAALLAFIVGQALHPIITNNIQRHTLTKILGLTIGIFAGMAAFGYYDKSVIPSFNQYLFAGIIGMILSQLFFYVLVLMNLVNTNTDTTGTYYFSITSVLLFSFYIANDIKMIKVNALSCKNYPDYINESLTLFIHTTNVFASMSQIVRR